MDEDQYATTRLIGFRISGESLSRPESRTQDATHSFLLTEGNDTVSALHCNVTEIPLGSFPSRASAITGASQITQMGVIADASWFEPRLMNNDLYLRGSDGIYTSSETRYWIDDPSASVNFYAFSPYNATGLALPGAKGDSKLSYAVPATADKQTDLILAVSKGIRADYGQPVGLDFKHLLAGLKINFTIPSGSKITEVAFNGLCNSATLDFDTDNPVWNTGSDRSLRITGTDIVSTVQFMVLPQKITDTDPVTLTLTVDYGTEGIRTYTHDLTATEWRMGINTIYDISVTNYSFQITDAAPADAHYVIYKTNLIAERLRDGTEWTVTCSADDNADITIQKQSDLNTFANQGFWTDREIDGTASKSARGNNTLTLSGNGTFPIAVFLPENTTDANRTISLNIRVSGKTSDEKPIVFTQLHPAWTSSGFGWEQTDDKILGEYGFKWNRVLYYGYVYTASSSGNDNYKNYCQQVIDNNNAGQYASVVTYQYGLTRQRYAIKIDYGLLTDIGSRADNHTDGLYNTKGLFNYGGAASTNSFVTTIEAIKKTESGKETEPAFRLGNGTWNEAPSPEGDPITNSTAVGECMKKNRYNLRRSLSDKGDVSLTPEINDADIVWYMPAVEQFSSIPTGIADAVNTASCWSSTCVTDRQNAFLGNGSQADRLSTHSVRAVRNRP